MANIKILIRKKTTDKKTTGQYKRTGYRWQWGNLNKTFETHTVHKLEDKLNLIGALDVMKSIKFG